MQLFVSRETYADVGACLEGKKFSFGLLHLLIEVLVFFEIPHRTSA